MPRVAQYGAPTVGPVQASTARFRAADNGGGAAGAIARGMQRIGDMAGDFALRQAEAEDQLARTNARNVRLQTSVEADKIYAGLEGLSGKNLLEAIPSARDNLKQIYSRNLDSVDQRTRSYAEFDMGIDRGKIETDIASLGEKASKVYKKEVDTSTLANLGRKAASQWERPDEATQSIAEGTQLLTEMLADEGLSDQQIVKDRVDAWRSGARRAAAENMMGREQYDVAKAFVDAFGDEMTPSDLLAITSALRGPLNDRQAASDFAVVTGGIPTPGTGTGGTPPVLGTMFEAIRGQESGGRQFASNGKPLTSSKGAIGIMQIMPGTAPEAAKLAGLPWDENRYRNDQAYNQRLGEAYFKQMLLQFGDPEIAAAAYNAGPGAVQKALSKGGDYLQHLPAETQSYVANFRKRVGAPQSGPRRWDREAVSAAIDRAADEGGWTFERRERAQSYADGQIAREEQSNARREAAADAEAKEIEIARGGTITDHSQIPPSVWSRMSDDARLRIIRQEADFKEKQAAVASIAAKMDGHGPLDGSDPDTRKAVDAHYVSMRNAYLASDHKPEDDQRFIISFIDRAGFVPPSLRSAIRAGARSADPALQVKAARNLRAITQANPQAVKDFDASEIGRAEALNFYLDSGVRPEDAAQKVREDENITPATRAARQQTYAAAVRGDSKKSAFEITSDEVSRAFGGLAVDGKTAAGSAGAQLVADFDALREKEFLRTGNLQSATASAMKTIHGQWSISRINGVDRIAKYAPEQFYGVFNDAAADAKWMREQAVSELLANGLHAPDADKRLMIVPHPTIPSINGRPVYAGRITGADGVEYVISDARGRPKVWIPDFATSKEAARQKRREGDRIRAARNSRELQIANQKPRMRITRGRDY